MPVDAKTIQIFLPHGEPRGIRIAEITTRIVQAVQVPRSHLDRLADRQETEHIALYFLFGIPDEGAKPVAYVGQTEDLRKRLRKHHDEKEFWTTSIFLISKTDSFTLAHLRYLEWHSIRMALNAARYSLDNGNNGSKPYVPEPIEADVLDAFETGSVLLSTLGFPIFEPVAAQIRPGGGLLYHCSGPDSQGVGRLAPDGFVVLKGSTARAESWPNADKYVAAQRERLIASGVLVRSGSALAFAEDHIFDSPSGAARIILGRNANGWTVWRTPDGTTLHDLERA